MKDFYNKYTKWIFITLLAIIVYKCNTSSKTEKEKSEADFKTLKERHCRAKWNELNSTQKTALLNDFIHNNKLGESDLHILDKDAYTALTSSVKYPETILIEGETPSTIIYLRPEDAIIKDAARGLITYSKNFTSENKLSMKVKGTMFLTIKYTAGCKDYEIVELKVE